ncbi:MAG TPA: sugar phosphate isomerase/epimerase [Ardenticatenaceae bacterium]|nr:sugar phosphate isomerase/epimerase [Ardenticatenaceae bacterium]
MRFIFSTGSLWSYSLERCFAFAERAGFDGIELMVDARWDTRQPHYLHGLIRRHRQPVVAVHSPFSPFVPGWPEDEVGRLAKAVELAESLGAAVVVHHLPLKLDYVWMQVGTRYFPLPLPSRGRSGPYRRWLETEYGQFQAAGPVTLCIENMPARRLFGWRQNAYHWNSPEQIARFPTITMDTTHLATWGLEPVEIYARLRERVHHVHLSNFDGREHRRPGDGHLRLDALLARMAADRYEGAISLELQPDVLDAGGTDEQVCARMAASLAFCRAAAGVA